MIILDAHIWVWWVQGDARLTQEHQQWLQQYQSQGLGVSIFSCWEVAKLAEKGRLILPSNIHPRHEHDHSSASRFVANCSSPCLFIVQGKRILFLKC